MRELDFGDMEGLLDREIRERFGDFASVQARMDRDLAYPGGENVAAVLERTLGALDEIAETGAQRIAVVAHGVVIRALAVHAMGGPVPRWRETTARLENGSITELERDDRTGGYSLQRLNDHAHLEPHPELLRRAWGVREN
jgi:broad specificity phosphatase PhoE